MDTDRKFPGSSAQSPDPSSPEPVDDLPTEDDTPPSQDWKHPDDGKSLSERDIEIPLKP